MTEETMKKKYKVAKCLYKTSILWDSLSMMREYVRVQNTRGEDQLDWKERWNFLEDSWSISEQCTV